MISKLTITLITIIVILLICIVIAYVYCRRFAKKWRREENKGDHWYSKQKVSSHINTL